MKLTDQQRAELKALAIADRRNTFTAYTVLDLMADLEEARHRIHDLETICDPAGLTIENAQSKDQLTALQIMYRKAADELAAARQQNEELRTQIVELRDLFLRENVRANKECSNNMELRISMQSAIEQAVAPYKRDAERYQEVLLHVGADCLNPGFTINFHKPTRWNHGSIAQHFTSVIDAALAAKEKSNG